MHRVKEIMLIDDDRATNYLSKYVIDDLDCCNQLTVHDMAQDALDDLLGRINYQQALPEIIFLDLNMPRMNGWEFLEQYKEFDLSLFTKVPDIYVLSTTMNPQDLLKAESIKVVTKFYAKPLTGEIIIETVSNNSDNSIS